jgi:hypothetical protein
MTIHVKPYVESYRGFTLIATMAGVSITRHNGNKLFDYTITLDEARARIDGHWEFKDHCEQGFFSHE